MTNCICGCPHVCVVRKSSRRRVGPHRCRGGVDGGGASHADGPCALGAGWRPSGAAGRAWLRRCGSPPAAEAADTVARPERNMHVDAPVTAAQLQPGYRSQIRGCVRSSVSSNGLTFCGGWSETAEAGLHFPWMSRNVTGSPRLADSFLLTIISDIVQPLRFRYFL